MEDARIIDFLRGCGADEHRHARGRSLLDHLAECAAIMRRWSQPDELVWAALLHSVYGTASHPEALLGPERRDELRALAGARAEHLAHLFAVVPREEILAPAAGAPATRDELDALVLLHLANLAEQAPAADGAPGVWLARAGQWVERLLDSSAVTLPRALAGLLLVGAQAEEEVRSDYLAAEAAGDADGLTLVASRLALLGEPCVRVAELAASADEPARARAWAAEGGRRLEALGVTWDRRRDWHGWHEAARKIERSGSASRLTVRSAPRRAAGPAAARASAVHPEPSRLDRYLESLNGPGDAAAGRVYPGLAAQAWHDPSAFPVARELTARADAVRRELLALDPAAYQRESERIPRAGEWDVLFLYERGRRHDEICDRCPVTSRIVEGPGAMRTMTGLIYVSRMRPGTHIAAHRGPTNLRLRCHLGLSIPEGDCAIRVGEQAHKWREGECLVFDDFLEHEAWNHTEQERLVLIVDLWHPDLSDAEIRRLAGLQRYALGHARGLERYWAANERAAG